MVNTLRVRTVRKSITLTKPQAAYLEAEAARLGLSASELNRRIVDVYRHEQVTTGQQRSPMEAA